MPSFLWVEENLTEAEILALPSAERTNMRYVASDTGAQYSVNTSGVLDQIATASNAPTPPVAAEDPAASPAAAFETVTLVTLSAGITVDDWDPGDVDTATGWKISGSTNNITGLKAPTEEKEITRLIINDTGGNFVLRDEDTGSLAANRFTLPAGADITLRDKGSLWLVREPISQRWWVIYVGVLLALIMSNIFSIL